jgi:hypothetical protein
LGKAGPLPDRERERRGAINVERESGDFSHQKMGDP